ncbi:MAG: hypothetical protein PHI83_09940, partial [Sphaerochaetaceae bacterium]|nr:hypothetical protein [Sphaerochaetaceae bacterium]
MPDAAPHMNSSAALPRVSFEKAFLLSGTSMSESVYAQFSMIWSFMDSTNSSEPSSMPLATHRVKKAPTLPRDPLAYMRDISLSAMD